MTIALDTTKVDLSLQRVQHFLIREARLLDDQCWDEWLECYAPEAEYWMPAWTDDDTLTTDPQTEISLIYYANRKGLEDRVFRLRTGRSSASTPLARTCHFLANLELLGEARGQVEVRYNWHTLSYRLRQTAQFFGTAFVSLDMTGDVPRITRKRIVLKDDYIHQVIDFYHV
jgi:benzoate/toluate 1,2-dioxygenase beta subunit